MKQRTVFILAAVVLIILAVLLVYKVAQQRSEDILATLQYCEIYPERCD